MILSRECFNCKEQKIDYFGFQMSRLNVLNVVVSVVSVVSVVVVVRKSIRGPLTG